MSWEEALVGNDVVRLRHTAPHQWEIASGLDRMIASQSRLAALAEACNQSGAADHLHYFLTGPYVESPAAARGLAAYLPQRRVKVPTLLSMSAASLLLQEYRMYGVPTGIYVPIDAGGWRTVIAPQEDRARAAAEGAEALLERGAKVVLVTYSCPAREADPARSLPEEPRFDSPHRIATRVREVSRVLPLENTYDKTLARMGAHTRRNLRAMQRRVIKESGAEYVERAEINLETFLDLNRACSYTVPDWVAQWRYDSARTHEGGVFSGLRAADGAWLSILGGRRSRTTVHVDWQMNLARPGALSLVTAMRSFFLADEIRRGMRSMRFEGGTPHSMRSAFHKETVCDLLFARRGISPGMLRAAGRLTSPDGVLAKVLVSEGLRWR